jgi:tetratricopeptide (TPR) repeat protein
MSNDLGNFPEENNKAIDRYEDMLRQNQEYFFDEEEFLDIIDYYIDKNSSIKAMKAIQLASRQYPYSTVFLIRQAQLLTSIAKFNEALMLLRKVELLEPSNPDVFLIKGSIFIKQNKSEQARECFDKAINYCYNDDDVDDVLLSIGFEYENAGRFD